MPRKLSSDAIGDFIAESASTIFTLEKQIGEIEAIGGLLLKTLRLLWTATRDYGPRSNQSAACAPISLASSTISSNPDNPAMNRLGIAESPTIAPTSAPVSMARDILLPPPFNA